MKSYLRHWFSLVLLILLMNSISYPIDVGTSLPESVKLTLVPEDIVKGYALTRASYFPFLPKSIPYDTNRVILIPKCDLEGHLMGYCSLLVYLGEGETPTFEQLVSLMEYTARIYYKSGDRDQNMSDYFYENFYHVLGFCPYFESSPGSFGGGNSIDLYTSSYWWAAAKLEEEFPDSDIKFKNIVTLTPFVNGYRFEVDGQDYIVDLNSSESKDDIYTIDECPYRYDIYQLYEDSKKPHPYRWDKIIEEINKCKENGIIHNRDEYFNKDDDSYNFAPKDKSRNVNLVMPEEDYIDEHGRA